LGFSGCSSGCQAAGGNFFCFSTLGIFQKWIFQEDKGKDDDGRNEGDE
jgi:hypothetical protein